MGHSSILGSSRALSLHPNLSEDRVVAPTRQAIALISVEVDPAAEIGEGRITGQRIHVRQMGEILAKLGWQVDLFTRRTDDHAPAIVEHSPHCRTIRLEAGPQVPLRRDRTFEHLPEFVDAFQQFQTKNAIYPLVHTHHWLSGWVGLQLNRQTNPLWVHTCHSLALAEYAGLELLPAIAQTRLAAEHDILTTAHRIVVTSPDELELVQSQVPDRSVRLIPGGTDLDTFRRMPQAEARALVGLALDVPVILYVGRFETRKGIETLLEACAVLRKDASWHDPVSKFQLVLVGEAEDSPERDRLEQRIQALELKEVVYFAGRISHSRLPLFYTAADVCVIPSQYEPFGLVALEAMACETPVVASDVGGLKFTVIPEETGLLVPVGDVLAFARAIARILQNPQWAEALRTRASSHVQQTFSWTTAGAQLSDLYRRLLAESLMTTSQP